MGKVPTDSVLRRHHEQMQRAARDVPTDSVLRRHYEQMQQAAGANADGDRAEEPAQPAATPPEPAGRPEPTPAPQPAAAAAPATSSQGGGFLGWLKRLFGG